MRAKRATFKYCMDKKFIKKRVHFGEFLKTWSLRSNSVTRQVSYNRTQIGGNAKILKFKCDNLNNSSSVGYHWWKEILFPCCSKQMNLHWHQNFRLVFCLLLGHYVSFNDWFSSSSIHLCKSRLALVMDLLTSSWICKWISLTSVEGILDLSSIGGGGSSGGWLLPGDLAAKGLNGPDAGNGHDDPFGHLFGESTFDTV